MVDGGVVVVVLMILVMVVISFCSIAVKIGWLAVDGFVVVVDGVVVDRIGVVVVVVVVVEFVISVSVVVDDGDELVFLQFASLLLTFGL